MSDLKKSNLYIKIAELLQTARQSVVKNINHTMVLTYWEIGRMIVEEEQQGKERAEYGKQVLKELCFETMWKWKLLYNNLLLLQ